RPGLAHTLTVGAHCLKAACVISEIGHSIDAGPIAARSASALTDLRVAVTAALMHDFGKCIPGPNHALRGEEQAALTASRLGLSPRDAESVGTLVRLHLLLIETATRADLDDEDSVLLAAGRLGQRELLPPLHLLSIADSLATGPGAWNEWTAALMGKLVTRLDSALSPDVDGAGIVASAKLVRAAALPELPDEAHDSKGFVKDAPLRYLADRKVVQVLEHAELVSELVAKRAPGAHTVRIDTGPLANASQVTVATRDRHGLLAILTGVLALAGLDILSVEAIGTRSGVALDTFTVRSATLAPLSTDTWARFNRLLDAALRGRLSISVRLAERRRHYRDESVGVDRVDVLPSDQYATSIRIRATDRVGLLYDVTRAMADSGLEIRSVTATTRHKTADDVFRVTDANGATPEEGLLGVLRMRLRELD
ncbi:MAG: ACT domain-containing protein, partial [Coriobacteriia bacterium]|nr:ACT domain-containing protein [Coriobacteriia bacterium]